MLEKKEGEGKIEKKGRVGKWEHRQGGKTEEKGGSGSMKEK